MKLRQTILERLTNKETYLNNSNINELMECVNETKMAIENELEDIRTIKSSMKDLNSTS